MDSLELEQKWRMLSPEAGNALRISGDCIPDFYIGLDSDNARCAILKLPRTYRAAFGSVVRENLSLEHFEGTGWIVLKLMSSVFRDVFNDLVISLYTRIRHSSDPRTYTQDFIDTFYKWSEFFRENSTAKLSDQALLGLIGELVYLLQKINAESVFPVNAMLDSWKGPYDTGHDFIFPDYNVEIKTKLSAAVDVHISSEFQLEAEPGKPLQLAVINVRDGSAGLTLSGLVGEIRRAVIARSGDFGIVLRALAQKGLSHSNLVDYDHYRITPETIEVYDCSHPQFPKISFSQLPEVIRAVKYSLRINMLESFVMEKTVLYGNNRIS
jgi:hypothetical protein